MPATMEYKTTDHKGPHTPVPPKGDGWILAAAAPAPGLLSGDHVYLYWQREIS